MELTLGILKKAATGQLLFRSGATADAGTETVSTKITVENGGNMGIGAAPSARLTVNDGNGAINLGDTTNNTGIYDGSNHTYQYLTNDTTSRFNFWSNTQNSNLSIENSDGTYVANLNVEGRHYSGQY